MEGQPWLWAVASPVVLLVGLADINLGFRADAGAVIAQWIAAELGLDAAEQEEVAVSAQLRDVGMLSVLRLFAKPAGLSEEERREVQRHPLLSEVCVRGLARIEPRFERIAAAVRHHHERWDGCGYPDGLAGEAIPLASRIVSVAEAFAAMRLGSSAREALPVRVARLRLANAASTQFDPGIAAAFERVVERQGGERPRGEWPYVVEARVGELLLRASA